MSYVVVLEVVLEVNVGIERVHTFLMGRSFWSGRILIVFILDKPQQCLEDSSPSFGITPIPLMTAPFKVVE